MRKPLKTLRAMFERLDPILKIICAGLALLVVSQLARVAMRRDPLGQLSFTAAPSLSTPHETPSAKKQTNSPPRQEVSRKGADLPPAVQARVERITQSEIFASVIRPLPM